MNPPRKISVVIGSPAGGAPSAAWAVVSNRFIWGNPTVSQGFDEAAKCTLFNGGAQTRGKPVIIGEVVVRQQDRTQHLAAPFEVVQIRAREVPARIAGTFGVERFVGHAVPAVTDLHDAARGERVAIAAVAGG